jgi:hypothetical protein
VLFAVVNSARALGAGDLGPVTELFDTEAASNRATKKLKNSRVIQVDPSRDFQKRQHFQLSTDQFHGDAKTLERKAQRDRVSLAYFKKLWSNKG